MLTQFYFNVYNYLNNLLHREEGQDLAEYAILIGLIALAVILVVTTLGGQIRTIFTNIGTTLANAGIPAGGS